METTLPSLSSGLSFDGLASVTVMSFSSCSGGAGAEQVDRGGVVDQEVVAIGRRLAQRLRPTDDLHDLGGDGVLSGSVHHAAQAGDEVFGVVGRGLHGALAGSVLGGRRIEQGGEGARLGVAGKQSTE